jgi:hypothetical protein
VEDCITIVGAGKRCTRGGIRIGPASELRNRHIISQGIREAVIDKLGFFHFGNYWDDPVGSLRCALKGHAPEEIRDSLIVLPEAFNIGQHYWGQSDKPWSTDEHVLDKLRRVCKDFSLSLLGGLIIETPPSGPKPPYSSAYFITAAAEPVPMCHKMCNDGQGVVQGTGGNDSLHRYTLCANDYDVLGRNPNPYGDTSFLALICMDAYTQEPRCPSNEDRHDRLKNILKTEAHNGTRHVVCIPSHIPDYRRASLSKSWTNSLVVVANSSDNPMEPGSFVAEVNGKGEAMVLEACQGSKILIRIVKLS